MATNEKSRIYICHTFYHAYIAFLKELALPKEQRTASLMLSSMSNDFTSFPERAEKSGVFAEVIRFDEKNYEYFPELWPLKKDTGSSVGNLKNRIRFCKRLGELEEEFVPVDLASYRDIYVFCDSDPIGYYLSYKKIRYHAVEDGLDCLRYRDTAREDNKGNFALKAALAKAGVIFIQNGYSKYCIDMEVNDLSVLDAPTSRMKEVRRKDLTDRLTEEDQQILTDAFIENREELDGVLKKAADSGRSAVLILTEPLCDDLDVRYRLFSDMIEEYGTIGGEKAEIVIKPHPRDILNYKKAFPDRLVLDAHFPMEILNYTGAEFARVVTVYTVPSSIHCAKEKVYLGNDFMDRYEDPEKHRHVTHADAQVLDEGNVQTTQAALTR